MKHRFVVLMVTLIVTLLAVALSAPPLAAQATTTVKGVCRDLDGKPYPNATVELYSAESGRKYTLKTNGKGEYFSLGIASGSYKVSLIVDGKVIFYLNGVNVSLQQEENVIDVDLKKEQAAQGNQMSEADRKKLQEQQEKQQKEQLTVKGLNDSLAGARAAMTANNWDQAVQLMTAATQVDPNRDLLWFTLADSLRGQGKALEKTDRPAAQNSYTQAVAAYEKAIALKPQAPYYNNLGEVYAKAGRTEDAVKAYDQAATLDPPGSGQYFFNEGAVLTNTNKMDEAIAAFKKAIAADPNKPEPYYWLGVNMIGKATLKGDKMIAPDGTAEAFQKYLELAPTGSFAQPAKDMLASIGASVETGFGKKKGTKKQ
jgi:tetratricopeptide (TPR) repeat protein